MAVFVLDKHGKPLMPCSEKRARLLLERGRARVPTTKESESRGDVSRRALSLPGLKAEVFANG
ncbi:RRXRR domain-containing protein [Cupriavidus necator]|nr:RRXRR domain-containing protein [Cupriavidus necator]